MNSRQTTRRNETAEYVIVGMDSFGEHLALILMDRGHRVLAIDRDPQIVQRLSDNLEDVIALDATDPEVLSAVGIDAFETAIVAMGAELPQAVLVTLTLKDLGVRRIICEAQSERDGRILLRVGADEIVTPDVESARAVADMLAGHTVTASNLHLGDTIVVNWTPPRGFNGPLAQLLATASPELRVLMVAGRTTVYHPQPDLTVSAGDRLLVAGPEAAVRDLVARGGSVA